MNKIKRYFIRLIYAVMGKDYKYLDVVLTDKDMQNIYNNGALVYPNNDFVIKFNVDNTHKVHLENVPEISIDENGCVYIRSKPQ